MSAPPVVIPRLLQSVELSKHSPATRAGPPEPSGGAPAVPRLLALAVTAAARLGITGEKLKDHGFPDDVADLVEDERKRMRQRLFGMSERDLRASTSTSADEWDEF